MKHFTYILLLPFSKIYTLDENFKIFKQFLSFVQAYKIFEIFGFYFSVDENLFENKNLELLILAHKWFLWKYKNKIKIYNIGTIFLVISVLEIKFDNFKYQNHQIRLVIQIDTVSAQNGFLYIMIYQ